MSDNSRIPRKIRDFDGYIRRTNNYFAVVILPSNGTRLGLIPTNVTDWDSKNTAWGELFGKWSDPLTKTTDINRQVKTFMKNFRTFAQPLLNIIAASPNAIDTDATTFNVVLVRKKPSHPTNAIQALCNAVSKQIGGSRVEFKCRTYTDSKRASLAEGSDGVEIAYIIGDKDTPVPDADSCPLNDLFTKATFTLSNGTINIGKILYIYFRWTNTKHPNLAGPWSDLEIIQIV